MGGLILGGLIWGAWYGGLDIVGNVPTPAPSSGEPLNGFD